MTHRAERIGERIDQNLDDLEARNPKMARELEAEYRRLEHKSSFAVAMSPVGRAERRP
jgi:hypothetical protein